MNPCKLLKCIVLLFVLSSSCYAASLSYTSGGSGGAVSLRNSYSLDTSTSLSDKVAIVDGGMLQDQYVAGSGANTISRIAGNDRQLISSEASSKSGLNSNAIAYAAGADLSFSQRVSAIGESKVGVYTSTGALSASQSAGAVAGAMASWQKATAQDGAVAAYQSSAVDGLMGFAAGDSATPKESAKVSSGLNGIGFMGGQMATFASSNADALASMQAESDESKAYSTAEATSDGKDAYSYLSSSNRLASSMAARTGSEPSADQDLMAEGDVLAYASSNDGTDAKNLAWESPSTSGHLSAQAGSSPSIDDELSGDVQSTSANLRPVPGHTVWQGRGGYIISDPNLIKDNQGRLHAFAQGGDSALYDNINGNWYGLGGSLTSDPFAIKDQQGRIHTFARNWDGSLVDNVFNTAAFTQYWQNLGGYITSDPAAALEPVTNGFLKVAARGGDGSLIMRDLDTRTMSGTWNYLGGYITSDPYPIFDAQKNIHVFAKGYDNSLWDNYGVWNGAVYVQSWKYMDGSISSDARPIQDPNNFNILHVFARNWDGQLADTRVNTFYGSYDRVLLGGFISPEGSGSAIYEGNPEPLADGNRLIHNFVRGGDGSLWDNVYDTSVQTTAWYPMGGYITSDASATLDASNLIQVGARGGDGALWINTVF